MQLANPVAALTSVPFELNYDDGFDGSATRTVLNIKPVLPLSLGPDWNLISRTELPVIKQGSQDGLGDAQQSFFVSPDVRTAGGWRWGVGAALLLPTATQDEFSADAWGLGPTAAVLRQTVDGWTYGALVNHVWSIAGDGDVNSTSLQPFLSMGLGQGRTVAFNIESSYDWNSEQWTAPANLSYSKVMKWGEQWVSLQGGVRYYIEAPAGVPDWGLRLALTLAFPR